MRRITAPAAAAFALLALAGCSADAKDFKEQGEKFIEGDEVRERMGMVRMENAECQEPADTNEDTTYTCTATGSDGNQWAFTIEISGSNSLRVISGEVVPSAAPADSVPLESTTPSSAAATTPPSDAPTTTPTTSPATSAPG